MTTPVDIIREFYNAVARGDVPGVVALLHPGLEWTEAKGFPYYGGTWLKPQDVVDGLLIPLARDWDDFSVIADDFIADGQRVVSLGAYSGQYKKTGKTMRAPFAHLWRVADGKLKSLDMYADTLLIAQAMR